MDTRPWRLDLPPGVFWFEVDRRDVLKAKQAELRRAGVHFTHRNHSRKSAASSLQSAKLSESNESDSHAGSNSGSSGNQRTSRGRQARDGYSLKADGWRGASADLEVTGWIHELVAAGLDLKQPVLWMAEGLLYYLEPESVGPMLQVSTDNLASLFVDCKFASVTGKLLQSSSALQSSRDYT